ncbi:Nitrogen regulation protein NR(I) [Planctomycetes bacterium Pan216]|uniref:DNA-binding transcriptional regulator NtrC n=1 Tax=Kolteria novifilia TaxID=2527975 RepID=A0A518BAI7_9BACT|nr:Nitrogen regulation protein NR(I) [Planctomycetes bacterium Pan216]
MSNPRVLIVDDEPGVCYSFRRVVERMEYAVASAATLAEGLRTFDDFLPDVVVLDLNLPDGSGLEAFQRIRERDPKCPVLFITAHGTTETALEAMKKGAFDYLIKPVNLAQLTELLERAVEQVRLMRQPCPLPNQDAGDRIVGHSPKMQEMCKDLGLLSRQDVNVLILGESGVGKELVARALYQHGPRSDKRFIAINCAALPEHLLESELFGHESGAFTDAVRQHIGKFEQCRDGTLFLDEIGDMAPSLQSKMLRVLQDQRFERLGGTQTIQTNARILAATNQNLEDLVNQGRFRADLYYRLRVATIDVPPLRERLEDVAELAHHFLFISNSQLGLDLRGFTPDAIACLEAYTWPGNVRELQSIVKEAMVRTRGPIVRQEYLPRHIVKASHEGNGEHEPDSLRRTIAEMLKGEQTNVYARVGTMVDRVLLDEVMQRTEGNQLRASKILGIDRKTLRQKLRNLEMLDGPE